MIDGAKVGYSGAVPGRFYLLYPYCVMFGDEETFSDFLQDESPIVVAMGAMCMLDRYPEKRDEVLARMKSDGRKVAVLAYGDYGSTMTLKELFDKLQTTPDLIAPLQWAGKGRTNR